MTPSKPYDIICNAHKDEAAWLEQRKLGIGASEIAAVMGLNSWKSALQIYAEKTGEIEPEDLSGNDSVFFGKEDEPSIAKRYRQKTGRAVSMGGELLRSKEYPWALATIDAWALDSSDKHLEFEFPLEIKTTSAFNADDWAEGAPEIYYLQVQHQLLVTGYPLASIACRIGGNKFVYTDIQRDETTIRKIIYHGERFWQMVQDRKPPEPDGSLSAKAALQSIYPEEEAEKVIELPAELYDIAFDLDALKEDKKLMGAQILEKENLIKAAMKDASRGVFTDGSGFTWKKQDKKEYTVPASSTRVLRRQKAKEE